MPSLLFLFLCTLAIFFATIDSNPSLFVYDALKTHFTEGHGTHHKGKNVWITGASSGIGSELALQLCDEGANVIISARREDKLAMVKEECLKRGAEAGAKVAVVPLDMMSDDKGLEKIVAEAIGELCLLSRLFSMLFLKMLTCFFFYTSSISRLRPPRHPSSKRRSFAAPPSPRHPLVNNSRNNEAKL